MPGISKQAMTRTDYLKYHLLNLLPSDAANNLILSSYVRGKERGSGSSDLGRKILSDTGRKQNIVDYLNGKGKRFVPRIVGAELGDKWYTGPAKLLSDNPLGRKFVTGKFLDRTLPYIDGTTDLAMQFMAAGGRV